MDILTVMNQKGGVGKTTTAIQIAYYMKQQGKTPLLIDMDPQCNLTQQTGASTGGKSLLGILAGEIEITSAIQQTGITDIIPSSPNLVGADQMFSNTGREYILKEALEKLPAKYDVVILDAPPHMGILSIMALTATNAGAIIPILADLFSLNGLKALKQVTIDPIYKYHNKGLFIRGLLLNRYKSTTTVNREMIQYIEQMAEALNTKLFKTYIRDSITASKAQIEQKAIEQLEPRSGIAEDYRKFMKECFE